MEARLGWSESARWW
uniref:Uncharacterized protein n=1 Tax=Arundo donax TaxID=35708 RepID=A0A0A9U733_ARUDO